MAKKPAAPVTKPSSNPLIDFTTIKDGERFELLVRSLFDSIGITPHFSGRGPDDGWDFIVYESFEGPISKQLRRKWLVQCKHLAKSGRAVQRIDVQTAVLDTVAQGASGYLLVTSTVPSSSVVRTIGSLVEKDRPDLAVEFWDRDVLEQKLLEERHRSVLKRFFPGVAAELEPDPVVAMVSRARRLGFPPKEIEKVAGIAALEDAVRTGFLDTVVLQPFESEEKALRTIWLDLAARTVDDADFEAIVGDICVLSSNAYATFLEQLVKHSFISNGEILLEQVAGQQEPDRRIDVLQTLINEFGYSISGVYDLLDGLDSEQLKLVLAWTQFDDALQEEFEDYITNREPPPSIYDWGSGAYIDEVFVLAWEPDFNNGQLTLSGAFEMGVTVQHGSDRDMDNGDGGEHFATATGTFVADVECNGEISFSVEEFEFDPYAPDDEDDSEEDSED